MDQEEENKCVSQLQEVFNSCDTTGTGYLDKEELTELCHKLHLDAHLPLLLQTLLGNDVFARVNFDEFKEGFVAVLSSTIDISISEDESSYMEPVIPDEVKPKFVKGSKRYGRRTQPELEAAENETNKYIKEQNHVKSKRKSQLRRSSSLESVESLKSDEEAGIAKESQNDFEGQGQLGVWDSEFLVHSGRHTNRCFEMTEHQVRAIWEQLGVGHNGYLNQLELATVCKNIGLEDLTKEDIEDLFNKLDQDGDGKVSFEEFHLGLCSHAPLPISSTPLRQKRPLTFCQPTEDGSRRTATPSLLSNIGGIHLFSSTDDGTGFGNPEQIVIIWEEEGIEDSKDILMSLDFNLEEQVNLLDLTTALDNELIATKNPIHLAALASYKHELQYQHGQIDQVTKERDKIKQDLEKAEKRNLQLAEEVDDHNSVMEQLNESKIRDLEQEYRQKLTTIRSELEKERDQVLQNTDQEMTKMEADLAKYQTEEAFLRDKLNLSIKENSRLQKEMNEIVGKLSESESQVVQLQATVEHIQKEKGVAYSHGPDLLIQEERFAEIIKEYEVQCRELRDRNDELLIQLETLRSQYSETKYSRLLAKMKDNKLLHHKAKEKINLNNGSAGKKSLSTKLRRSSSAAGVNVTVESESSPMNMETELTKHQLKEQQQEIQDLKIQLETKVNYYEREVALMKSNFEKERRDTEQSFKIEISELEEQKADLEELNAKYQEVIDGMKEQLQKSAHIQDMEKRFEKERAEMEQYYAKEISTLGKRLTSEKDQLEEELKRAHQHELQAMRGQAEEQLKQRLAEIEAQYAEYCQSIVQQHHCEKEETLRKHEEDKKALRREHVMERSQWEERERALMVRWKKEQLKLEEKHNEEQALICKTFAVEKEQIEDQYRTRIHQLNEEIQSLHVGFMEHKRCPCTVGKHELLNRHSDVLEESLIGLNQQPFSVSGFYMGTGEANVCKIDQDEINTPKMVGTGSLVENKDELVQMEIKQIKSQHLQYQQLLCSLKAAEEREALLEKAETNALIKIEEMEKVVSSLRAQLQDETKGKKVLLGEQNRLEEERDLLVSQVKAKEEECLLPKEKEKELLSKIQESNDTVEKLRSSLQELISDKEELQKQVAGLPGLVEELEQKKATMAQMEQACKQSSELQNVCLSLQDVEETHLVEELINRNVLLSQEVRKKEEEISILQSEIREASGKLQQMEEEATNKVQYAMEELEKEKSYTRDKLFKLEDLVREIETSASLDNRMELCRLSEDNSLLRKKLEPLQQKVSDLEELNTMTRIQVEELKREKEKLHSDTQELTKQNEQYQDELSQLSTQSLQLNGTLSDLKAQNVDKEETIQQLNIQLQEVEQRHKEAAATIEQMQEALNGLEQERLQRLGAWQSERQHLEQELHMAKAENEKYRDELSQLNGTLSHLSAQNLGKEEAIQRLNSEVRVKTQQQKEVAATTEQLREMLSALEEEKLQRLTAWQNERQNLEQELRVAKAESEKYSAELSQLNTQSLQLNGSLSDLSAQNVGKEETIRSLNAQLKEVARQQQEATATIDQLREALSALEEEKLQRLTAWQSERRQLEQELDISKEKLLAMGALQQDVSSLKQAKQALEEECQRVTKELKESAHKVIEITEVESDLKRALGECQDLRRIQAQLREALDDSQDKVLEANTKLMLAQSQHMREVQQLKEQVSASVPKDQLSQTQNRLLEEQQIVQQMQEKLRFHAEQANRQLAMQQEAHEKLLRKMEDRMENVEMNLKNVRMILQDKVNQLKEQLEKNAKSDLLLKDLYVENAHLMKALQVTEERQKSAEKKNYLLVEKIAALNNAIRKITPASLGV
ncbi:ninein-like protein isoform X1 [Spea bombifrons]|uniref:ninein-like protein isoform X1 n=1 Tax=Spea bombifrons TaxID=233779 RepID=UPI0023496CE9|nr:ninein-like protein isoform X1 [Spea bombifrons]